MLKRNRNNYGIYWRDHLTLGIFLANSENKSILNEFLGKSFIEDVGNQTLVVTYKDTVFSNNNTLVMDEDIAICLTEEADQRLV